VDNIYERFCVAMYWLADKYPTQVDGKTIPRKLTMDWLDDYFDAISDLSIERIEAGAKWHYGHSKFFPEHPGDLRESIEAIPYGKVASLPAPAGDLEDPAEMETPHEEAMIRLTEILSRLNGRYDTKLEVGV